MVERLYERPTGAFNRSPIATGGQSFDFDEEKIRQTSSGILVVGGGIVGGTTDRERRKIGFNTLDNIPTEGRATLVREIVSNDEVADSYDQIAEEYLDHKKEGHHPGQLIELPAFIDIFDRVGMFSKNGLRIIDLGCGTGWLSHEIFKVMEKRKTKPGLIVGVDISRNMIELAQREFSRKYPEENFVQGSVSQLEYGDGAFDYAVSANAFDCMPDYMGALFQTRRIIKNSGAFIFSIRHPERNKIYAGSGYQNDKWYKETWDGAGGKPVYRHYMNIEDWRVRIGQAGFTIEDEVAPIPSEELREIDPEMYEKYSKRRGALIFFCKPKVK